MKRKTRIKIESYIMKFFELISANYLYNIGKRIYKLGLLMMGYGYNYPNRGESNVHKLMYKVFGKKDNYTIFNVGANYGQYLTGLLDAGLKKGKILCFEPGKIAYSKLQENVKNFSNVELFNFGFSNISGESILYSDLPGSGGASLNGEVFNLRGINHKPKEEKIILKTVDEFVFSNNISKIDFMNIDVEGYELFVLEGAKKTIDAGKIISMQFEFNSCSIATDSFFIKFWDLLNKKYDFYFILPNGLKKINDYYYLDCEIFAGMNIFLKLKESDLFNKFI